MQSAGGIIGESSVKREQAEDLLKRNSEFERTLTQNENDLRDLDMSIDRINAGIVDLNEKVSVQFTLYRTGQIQKTSLLPKCLPTLI